MKAWIFFLLIPLALSAADITNPPVDTSGLATASDLSALDTAYKAADSNLQSQLDNYLLKTSSVVAVVGGLITTGNVTAANFAGLRYETGSANGTNYIYQESAFDFTNMIRGFTITVAP